MTYSSVIVYELVNPLAKNKELQLAVEKPIKRAYQEAEIIKFAGDGLIPTREEIEQIEQTITSWDDAKGRDDYTIFHSFADGMYTREMHVEKGEMIVGEIHRNDHIVNLLKGSLVVIDEFGNRRLDAPASFISKAGVKRVGFILEDTVWQDIHRTDKTNIEEAEKEIFVSSYDEIEIEGELCRESLQAQH